MPSLDSNLEDSCSGKRAHIAAVEITRDHCVRVVFRMGSLAACVFPFGIGIAIRIGVAVDLAEKVRDGNWP